LKKLGLVEFIKEGKKPTVRGISKKILTRFQVKRYYRIVPTKEDAKEWNKPQYYLAQQEGWGK